jgi:hypothetical protein
MDQAVKKLNEAEWVGDDVVDYLNSLESPDAKAAMEAAAKRLRDTKRDSAKSSCIPDGKLYTLKKLDNIRKVDRLKALPLR